MFRHKGKSRSLRQNLGIASLLSFVAGIVNVVGFLAVQKLTTNVTGHFALMVEEALKINLHQSFYYFLYIFFFFLGSFCSNLIIQITEKLMDKYIFIIPVLSETVILTSIALLSFDYILANPNLIACSMLFAMGLQNSLVTTISSSAVRTTHLTGLFTDLGIEVSQLFFFKAKGQQAKLKAAIKLKLTIITAFFLGGILAGVLFSTFKMKTLFIASFTLLIGLTIDYVNVKIRLKKLKLKSMDHSRSFSQID
ncbi:YoaK family protein [Spirosoma panaciterrae]|uniref:YoaK family protein n=1 Tax=Spirosoma panaciterrae TaxID=496058 RepID=UPI0004773026|nr:YoaK family protein [Spirosoma panaciterrae]